VAAEVPVIDSTLPAEPVAVHAPTVWIVVPSAIVEATVLVEAISVNVLLPVNVVVLTPVAPPMVSLLYVLLPLNDRAVVDVSDRRIFAVPALSVDVSAITQTRPVPVAVQVPDPIFTTDVEPNTEVIVGAVTLYETALKVPAESCKPPH
jgi:hypothetical protein